MSRRSYRKYDQRLKNLVAESEDISQFHCYGIPKSTLRQWQKNGHQEFFTIPELSQTATELIQENIALKSQLSAVIVEHDLVATTIKIFGFQIQYKRLPSSDAKAEILTAIKKASECISLQACLLPIGLTAARYHHWVKLQVACMLDDRSSCPRVSPSKMLPTEVNKIKELYTAKEFAHYSTIALSWFAKKTGEVVASASTWSRVIREHGLKRNRVRIYPAKPKIGIRASAPGQIWHLDLTILRLQDGTRAFVQVVIDNFSRYVLAWKVSRDYGGLSTRELLLKAIAKAQSLGMNAVPDVWVDSGTENLNTHVDELVASELIRRTVAQIDVEASNSMVEMLFHRFKNRYMFTIPLTSFEAVENGADYYFIESNTHIPMAALKGATPEEVVTRKWTPEKMMEMKEKVVAARLARTQSNTSRRCQPCLV
jgi:putative transposase